MSLQTAPRFHPLPVSEFLLGGIDNSPSKNSSQIEIPPSIDNPSKKPGQIEISPGKDSPSKKRRNWGEGNGTIHWRTITRGGKDYPQAYYHWQEKGRKKTRKSRVNLKYRVSLLQVCNNDYHFN